jgi:hypothetical protein
MASFPSLADVLGKIDGRLAEVVGGVVPINDRPVLKVRKMLAAWSDGRGWREQEGQSEYRQAVRSVLPLMLELAGYLTPDRQGGECHAPRIHGTLSQALLTLAVAAGAARMEQQRQLCEELHLLLEDFRFSAWSRQPDLPGLLIDFLKFLDAMDRGGDGENSRTARRVREKLRSLRMLSNRSSW